MQESAGRTSKYWSNQIHCGGKNASLVTAFCTQDKLQEKNDEECGKAGVQYVCFSR
jgi:hypothetical protein